MPLVYIYLNLSIFPFTRILRISFLYLKPHLSSFWYRSTHLFQYFQDLVCWWKYRQLASCVSEIKMNDYSDNHHASRKPRNLKQYMGISRLLRFPIMLIFLDDSNGIFLHSRLSRRRNVHSLHSNINHHILCFRGPVCVSFLFFCSRVKNLLRDKTIKIMTLHDWTHICSYFTT